VTEEKKLERAPASGWRAPAQPAAPALAGTRVGLSGGTPKGDRPTVLVVDDLVDHRELIVAALEGAGYRMLEAGDADSALALLRQEVPNLVFLDLQLRGSTLDGVHLLQTLKRERPDVPVIAYTAYAPLEWQEKARAAGCDDYLVKPVDLAEMRAIARNYLSPTKPRGTTDPGPHPDPSPPSRPPAPKGAPTGRGEG
jgi:CheY-like chemotaxis protein